MTKDDTPQMALQKNVEKRLQINLDIKIDKIYTAKMLIIEKRYSCQVAKQNGQSYCIPKVYFQKQKNFHSC